MYIPGFTKDGFTFHGAYVVAQKNQFNMLLSHQGTSLVLDDNLFKQLESQDLSQDLKFVLVQRFFADVGNDSYKRITEDKITPTYFILDLTKACNFSCVYCFRDENQVATIDKQSLHKNLEYVRDFYHSNHLERIVVQPWGGEPLITFDLIEYMQEFFKKEKMNAKIELESNGTLISDDLAKRMKELDLSVGISIDGNQELHDKQRKFLNGKGTYDQVKAGIKALNKYYGNKIGTISVITKYTVSHSEEIINHFVKDLNLKYFKFNIVRENPFSREDNLCPSKEEIVDMYRRIFDLMIKSIGTEYEFVEDTVRSRMVNILLSTKKNCCNSRGCTGGRSILSIDRNGDIFPCEMTDFINEKIGDISNNNLMQQINEATEQNDYFKPKHIEKCDNCPWWVYCRGGCSSRVKYLGKPGTIDEIECSINETLYPLVCDLIVENVDLAYRILSI